MTREGLHCVLVYGPHLIAITALAQLAVAHETARTLLDWTWPRD